MLTAKRGTSCAQDGQAHHSALDHDDDDDNSHDEIDLAFDPTLASCCERDEHEYKKALKLKAVLTAHDPTSKAVRMRQQLFQPPPAISTVTPQTPMVAPQVPQSHVSISDSDSSDFDDSDDELGMEAMLTVRRKQLEQQFQKAAQDAVDGYGIVLDTGLAQLMQELRDEPDVPRVVLVVDSSTAEESGLMRVMRNEMTAVAQKFLGTKFYVAMAGCSDDDVLQQLRVPSASSLTAFRRGERVDSIALDPRILITELKTLWEARFLPWLTKCNVLISERQIRQIFQQKKREAIDKDETERQGFDCGVDGCRLRFGYEHEHVGTSRQTKNEIAAWRQTSE